MPIAETPVRLPIPPLPLGYRMGGVHAGLKRNPTREDVSLVVSDVPAIAAGVYTTNLVFAAPVAHDRSLTPGRGIRGVVVNSGNANACWSNAVVGTASAAGQESISTASKISNRTPPADDGPTTDPRAAMHPASPTASTPHRIADLVRFMIASPGRSRTSAPVTRVGSDGGRNYWRFRKSCLFWAGAAAGFLPTPSSCRRNKPRS